jgi:hypothetical protein
MIIYMYAILYPQIRSQIGLLANFLDVHLPGPSLFKASSTVYNICSGLAGGYETLGDGGFLLHMIPQRLG